MFMISKYSLNKYSNSNFKALTHVSSDNYKCLFLKNHFSSLLCHCWQPNFIHVMVRSWSWKGRKILEASELELDILLPTPQPW